MAPPRFQPFLVAAVGVVGALTLSGCTPAPVATFERFYAATAAKDAATVRALLCPAGRTALQDVDDATLARALQVTRGVQRVTVQSEAGDAAVVDVEDATGQHQLVRLARDANAPLGWCVADEALAGPSGPAAGSPAPAPPSAPGTLP